MTATTYQALKIRQDGFEFEDDSATPQNELNLRMNEGWTYDWTVLDGIHSIARLKTHELPYLRGVAGTTDKPFVEKFKTDVRGNILEAVLADKSVVRTFYTKRPTSIEDLAGGLVDYTWDALHGKTDYVYYGEESGPKAKSSTGESNRIGLVSKIIYAAGTGQEQRESFTYDAHRMLDAMLDVDSVHIDYSYDALGRLTHVVNTAQGHQRLQQEFIYDALGHVISTVEKAGAVPTQTQAISHITQVHYDVFGRITREENVSGGAVVEYDYQRIEHGEKITVTAPRPGQLTGTVQTVSYIDSHGNVVAVYLPQTTIYAFADLTENAALLSPQTGSTVRRFAYNKLGRTTAEWTTSAIVGAFGVPAVTDAQKTHYRYDSFDRLTKTIGPEPGPVAGQTQSLPAPVGKITYDRFGYVRSESAGYFGLPDDSSEWRTTWSFYDSVGQSAWTIGPENNSNITLVDQAGRTTAVIDGRSNLTQFVYDARDRLTDVIDAEKNVTHIDYFTASELLAMSSTPITPLDDRTVRAERITDPRLNVTWKQYDAEDRLIRIVHSDPDGPNGSLMETSEVYLYNADGTLAAEWQEVGFVQTPNNKVTYLYDDASRLTEKRDALGLLVGYQYDRQNNVTVQTASNGAKTKFIYDELGRVTATLLYEGNVPTPLPGLQITATQYDYLGNAVHTFDQYGDETFYQYDRLGRVTLTREPDTSFISDAFANHAGNKITRTFYNDFGDVEMTTGPMGQQTQYKQIDELGRAKEVFENNTGSTSRSTFYEFDAVVNVKKITDADGNATTYKYDSLNRVISEGINLGDPDEEPNLFRTYHYDSAGNLDVVTDRNGRMTVYLHDALNRRTDEIGLDEDSVESYHAVYTYNQDGNLESAEDANSKYEYSNYDVHGRAQHVEQTIRIPGVTGRAPNQNPTAPEPLRRRPQPARSIPRWFLRRGLRSLQIRRPLAQTVIRTLAQRRPHRLGRRPQPQRRAQ